MNLASASIDKLRDDFSGIGMLPGVSVWDYLQMCRARHPDLYRRLNPGRSSARQIAALYAGMSDLSTHFEGKLEGGRGDLYRQAQNTNYLIRSVGFLRIFDLAVAQPEKMSPEFAVLDALGGNGTMTRIVRATRLPNQVPLIVTNDVSAKMIESAISQGLPAIRQPLQNLLWFDDCTFDAVIVAYGTHHVPPADRARAISEAYRVLKPGGRIVLQDFEIGCPTTKWYDEVLDRYTVTGHKFQYFTRAEFNQLLTENCFDEVEIMDVYDPFILHADDPQRALRALLDYIATLFALEKLFPDNGKPDTRFWDELEALVRGTSTFYAEHLPAGHSGVTEVTVSREGQRYRAEIPRFCLVATGRRPYARPSSNSPQREPHWDPTC